MELEQGKLLVCLGLVLGLELVISRDESGPIVVLVCPTVILSLSLVL